MDGDGTSEGTDDECVVDFVSKRKMGQRVTCGCATKRARTMEQIV